MRRLFVALSGAAVLMSSVVGSVQASITQPTHVMSAASAQQVVSANPANRTPRVLSNAAGERITVYKMAQLGTTMFAGGEFTRVENYSRTTTYARRNLFAFDVRTGAVTPLSVTFNGAVWAITSDGTSLYVGGTFSMVNGVARRGIVKLNPTTARWTRRSMRR